MIGIGGPMDENELRRAIICDRRGILVGRELASDCPGDCIAHLSGWHGMYATPLRAKRAWATPTRGDWGVGWPDLTLVSPRRGRVIFAELKSATGVIRPEQRAVLHGLYVAGAEVHLWRPADLDAGLIWRIMQAPEAQAPNMAELEVFG